MLAAVCWGIGRCSGLLLSRELAGICNSIVQITLVTLTPALFETVCAQSCHSFFSNSTWGTTTLLRERLSHALWGGFERGCVSGPEASAGGMCWGHVLLSCQF